MFDCHVHSSFSGDCDIPGEVSCNRAIELGLEGIAFTDHLDLDYPDKGVFFDIDFNEYSMYIDSLKKLFKSKLKILKGIEIGYQPQAVDSSLAIIQSIDFDFVIASVHVIDGQDPYFREYYRGKSKREAFIRYLEKVYDCVHNFHDYDVVGHIGYVRRYGNYDDKSLKYSDYSDILDSILKKVISEGKGIEINSSGLRNELFSPLPDFDIIKRYSQLGGEIITMGSDAHFDKDIAHSFDIVREGLVDSGIKYVAHFEKRVPVFQKL